VSRVGWSSLAGTKTYMKLNRTKKSMSLFDESIAPLEVVSSVEYERNGIHIFQCYSLSICNHWPSPVAIISDGPYGISGFSGDIATYEGYVQTKMMLFGSLSVGFVRLPLRLIGLGVDVLVRKSSPNFIMLLSHV